MIESISRNIAALVLVISALVLAGWLSNSEALLYFLAMVMAWSIFAGGFDIVFGVTGLLSFGHSAFFGLGAYVFGILTTRLNVPWTVALLCAGLAAGFLGILFGLITRRVSGLYYSLITLAVAEFLSALCITGLRTVTGGADGIPGLPRPQALGIDFFAMANFYWVMLTWFAISIGCLGLLRASPLGRALLAVKQNEVRAQHLGFNIFRMKTAAFVISGFFSGLAGGLVASLLNFSSPSAFSWGTSGDVLIMTLLGGAGTLFGPLMGALAFEAMREFLSQYTVHWYGLLGGIFILCTIFLPGGLLGAVQAASGHRARGSGR